MPAPAIASKKTRSLDLHWRIVNETKGIVDLIASTASVDSYNEIVRQDGYDFSRVEHNFPLVDSHDYSSVQNLLGTVTDFSVREGKLSCRAQFAIDVAENDLARLAFGMVKAGYLRACSIGFMPLAYVTPGDGRYYDEALEGLNLPSNARPSVIYTSVRLAELSICILGANPDALVAARKSSGLPARTLELLQKSAGIVPPFPQPQSQQTTDMSKSAFLTKLAKTTGPATAIENLTLARRGQSESDYLAAIRSYGESLAVQRRLTAENLVRSCLEDHALNMQVAITIKRLSGAQLNNEEMVIAKDTPSFTEGTALGQGMVPAPVADIILSLTEVTGVFRTLGVIPMPGGTTKFARVTALPNGQWIMPDQQSAPLVPDTTLAGESLSGRANTVGILLEPSMELWSDQNINANAAFLIKCAEGLAGRIDATAFGGTGATDSDNGGQTGIFPHPDVPLVSAGNGNIAVNQLTRADFLSQVGAVNPKALQYPCRYWANPLFLPALMLLKDGNNFLVKTPLENDSEDWSLCGFPLSLTVAAPGVDGNSKPVCVFGRGEAYNVGLRREVEITVGNPKFIQSIRSIRALMRARLDMADATWFAILKTAAL